MKKFMDWATNKPAPKMNRPTRNPWTASVQEMILTTMLMILIGSFTTILTAFGGLTDGFPDFSPLPTFSSGLLSLYFAYLIPYPLVEKKRHNRTKKGAGLAGIGFLLMLVGPTFDEVDNILFQSSTFGNGGMITVLMTSLFIDSVMNVFSIHSLFKESSAIPDFITIWFDTLIPVLIILFIGWLFILQLYINILDCTCILFFPILSTGDSFLGSVVLYFFGYAFLYAFGISTWVIYPIKSALVLQGIAANQAAVAAGDATPIISADGVSYYFILDGGGYTLAFGLMVLSMARSKKCKVIGKASLVSNLCNINEPLYLVRQSHLIRFQ